MNRIQDYNRRKAFVELTLGSMLQHKTGFDFIKYRQVYKTEEQFVRIGDLRGCTVTFDVTALTLEQIMKLVCDYIVYGPTGKVAIQHIVADDDKLFSIAPLFREVA